MNNQKNTKLSYLVLLPLVVLLFGLVGCGTIQVGAANPGAGQVDADGTGSQIVTGIEIGIEPTPIPESLTYVNSFYGFQFTYPETWTLEEQDHAVLLEQGTLTLRINYRWDFEENPDPRTGAPAGDFIYGGNVTFLDQNIPVQVLEFEKKAKAVFYNEEPEIVVDNLIFSIVLEDLSADYQALEISLGAQNDANSVLESFVRITPQDSPSTKPSPDTITEAPYDGWVQYTNSDYGFSFWYPSSFSLVEESHAVKLEQDAWQLVIAFRRNDESVKIVDDSILQGELQEVGLPPHFLGQEIQVYLNTFDWKVKNAFYGEPFLEIETGSSLSFTITFTATGDAFEPGDYLDELHPQFEEILASFRIEN